MFAALWLPFSAVASVTMPFCQHAGQQLEMAQAGSGISHEHMHESDHDHAAMMDHGTPQNDNAHSGAACDQCSCCHLASAGLMASNVSSAVFAPPARSFAVSPAPTFPSLTAEPLPRPPRTS